MSKTPHSSSNRKSIASRQQDLNNTSLTYVHRTETFTNPVFINAHQLEPDETSFGGPFKIMTRYLRIDPDTSSRQQNPRDNFNAKNILSIQLHKVAAGASSEPTSSYSSAIVAGRCPCPNPSRDTNEVRYHDIRIPTTGTTSCFAAWYAPGWNRKMLPIYHRKTSPPRVTCPACQAVS